MAKCYTLEKSDSTGWWYWACTDNNKEGWEATKSEAKDKAATECGTNCSIVCPAIDASIKHGYLSDFTMVNLEGQPITFSAGEINENLFYWISGIACYESILCTATERVIAILKVWGIYSGGFSEDMVKDNHDLSSDDFDKLAAKEWYGLTITLEDDDTITWDFPA